MALLAAPQVSEGGGESTLLAESTGEVGEDLADHSRQGHNVSGQSSGAVAWSQGNVPTVPQAIAPAKSVARARGRIIIIVDGPQQQQQQQVFPSVC